MNTIIITVAGTATRFNKDTSRPTLKCLYYHGDPRRTLLYGILEKSDPRNHFVIVGGYLFEKLQDYIEQHCGPFKDRITLVYNERFDTYGSGYSLIRGVENIPQATQEITFVEGDLFFDTTTYKQVLSAQVDVITINGDPIEASKAVAIIVDQDNHPNYIYDTKHSVLSFEKPFRAIYNSAQIWKFTDPKRLQQVISELSQKQIEGTNLEIIEGYFTPLNCNNIDIVRFQEWCNCNTVADYDAIFNIK